MCAVLGRFFALALAISQPVGLLGLGGFWWLLGGFRACVGGVGVGVRCGPGGGCLDPTPSPPGGALEPLPGGWVCGWVVCLLG